VEDNVAEQLSHAARERAAGWNRQAFSEQLVPYQINSCTKNKESGRLGKGRNNDDLT
jgi:hypothetical protein